MKSIIIDVGGCDRPDKLIDGVIQAAKKHGDYAFVFVGDKAIVEPHIPSGLGNVSVEHAPTVITNDDSPTHALRQKSDSSLVTAFNILNGSEDAVGLFSGGSTGAVLTGATLLVGRIKGVHRPVLASLMPTSIPGKVVCIADSGANVDSKPEFMAQFALMASEYIKAGFGIEKPVVGLLSVGTEDKKGDERTKAAHALIKELPLEFAGNMEARDALTGVYDVIVCDGFSGNVLVKSTEGTAKMVMGKVKEALTSSLKAKLGALMMKKALKSLKASMDYHSYGGAPFLGVKKIVVKGHGSTNEVSAAASVNMIISLHENRVLETIEKSISGAAEPKADVVQ
jgi:glycerol-3-phosphate acyltransferase PlsX